MLRCESADQGPKGFDELAVFVAQLAALGVPARIDARSVPEGLTRNAQFDIAPFLADGAPGEGLVLVEAEKLTDQKLARLRRISGREARPCFAFGAFESRQALIGVKARLSYVLDREPEVFNTLEQGAGAAGCPVFGVERRERPEAVPRLLLLAPDLREAGMASALVGLALSRRFRTVVLTDGRAKQDWVSSHGRDIDFYHYGEILPADLAEQVDICVCCSGAPGGYRQRSLIANLAVSGAALIDGTPGHGLARAGDAFIRGPIDLVGLGAFVTSEILPNLERIGAHTRRGKFAEQRSAAPVLRFLERETRGRVARAREDQPPRVVFMPTNGVGLGHAQRCSLIAGALAPERATAVFAAFPSCGRLIKSYGFDVMPLIGRSGLHERSHENDLANGLRIGALTAGAGALVFDGGYVFDSVCRTILGNRLRGIWIRRGLWQASQDNSVALDREKVFDRVIVPREAFDELNAVYSRGDHLREVGPVVRLARLGEDGRVRVRAELAERFGREFDRLVVTLLGAGVAADRGGQIQAISAMMARRSDSLHLVVVWPTATVMPGWFEWPNTAIVKTHFAGVLAAAADLCVSAAGYNSFHEALYNRVPTIFVPQTGSFMDDQRARARAARERGVASLVEAEALMTLERELGRHLDEDKLAQVRRALMDLDLPEPGTAAAARMIEEMVDGSAKMDAHPVADHGAGRG